MYKAIRKKVAESVSKLDSPEHYDWNKWIREPDLDEFYIDIFSPEVLDTNDINLWPPLPSTRGFTFDLPKIKLSKAFKQLNIAKQKTSKIFFSFPKSDLKEIKEILAKAEIDYSLSVSVSGKGAIFRLKDGKKKQTEEASAEILIREFYLMTPRVSSIPLLLSGDKIYTINVSLNDKVKVIDLLANLKTEVKNVELLNSDNFITPINSTESRKIQFQPLPKSLAVKKIEVMNLEKLLHSLKDQEELTREVKFNIASASAAPTEIKIPAVFKNKLKILSVKNIKISPTKVKQGIKVSDKVLSPVNSFSFKSKDQDGTSVTRNTVSKELEEILQPAVNFTKEEKDKVYDFLYEYQKSAADFLSEKEIAFLNDELGTGKTLEITGALKILFRKKDISNALIVCRLEETGWPNRNPELGKDSLSGWHDHLHKYSPEISASIVNENRNEDWKNPSAIKIINYQLFSEALEKGLVPLDELNRKGCLILDEFEDFPGTSINPLPKYLWFLSGIPADELKEKISSVIGSDEPVVSFGRTKGEVADSLPRKIRQDYWLQMDQNQKLEYEKALESGREKIYDLVQAGNPFLVQSNVFTLIHQLTQIGNFHGKSESSAKSELLLHHVKSIQKSGKQVFVYSQYDRQGTQRLEKLFAKNKIKYVLYQAGISLKEMEDAIRNFAKDKSITVFLAGMKATNSKINLADVPYMIHFDQWWSPVTTWQAEERVNANTNDPAKLKLNVYNYFVKNSIDEKIQLKLREKGLDNKNLFDLLSSEGMYSLITNEDWLEVLELIEPKDPSELKEARKANLDYLLKLTPDDFSHKIKALLGRIGYKNASFKTSFNPDEVRIFASAIKNSTEVKVAVQCLTMKVVHKKIVKEFADSLVTNTEKIFAFASGEFDQKLINNPGDDRIVLIDKHQIANYLNMFSLV